MFSISVLCNHFGVQAEIESYSGKKGAVFQIQDGGDVYFKNIYGAVGLQCKMAIYTSLLNDRLELGTVARKGSGLRTYQVVVSAPNSMLHSTC